MRFLDTFYKALRAARKNVWRVLLCVLVDFAFLLVFGSIYATLFGQTAEHVKAINDMLANQTAQFVATSDPSVLSFGQDALVHYHAILWGIVWIIISLYLLWSVSEGIDWWAVQRGPFFSLMLRMFLLNLLWIAGFVSILFGTVWIAQQNLTSPVPLIGPGASEAAAAVLCLLLLYFMAVSYAFITHAKPLRTSLVHAIRDAGLFVPVCVVASLVVLLLGYLVVLAGNADYIAGLVMIALLLLWVSFCRVWLAVSA